MEQLGGVADYPQRCPGTALPHTPGIGVGLILGLAGLVGAGLALCAVRGPAGNLAQVDDWYDEGL